MRWIALFPVAVAACGFSGATPGGDGPVDPVVDGAQLDGQRAIDAPEAVIDARQPPDARLPDADPPDASPPDAEVFAPELCPAAYNLTTAAAPGSRFRYIATNQAFALHHADCNDDRPGWTHLVVLDTQSEATSIGDYASVAYKYVGGVQDPGATTTAQGWRWFTGGTVTTTWSSLGDQPDDGNGSENGAESLLLVSEFGTLHDVTGQNAYPAMCECDGLPIDPTIATWIP